MLRKITGLVALLCLGACATPYVATPYDRASASVRSVGVLDDSMADKAIAYEVASVGSNFGLIGALVDAGIQAERQDAVNDALRTVSFDAEAKLEARLTEALRAQGYNLVAMPGAVRPKRDFLPAYPGAADGAEAYLDVAVMNYGYMSAGAGQPFRPMVAAKVRLVRASDSSTLMENQIIYNPLNAVAGVVTLPPNPQYAFSNRSDLLADPARLAAGIEDALNQVATTAAQLLR